VTESREETAKKIVARLQEAMARLGITITDLGFAWGGYRQTAQHWINNGNLPPARDIPHLCDLLLITPNELFCVAPLAPRSPTELERARHQLLELAEQTRERQRKTSTSARKRLVKPKKRPSPTRVRLGF